MVCNSLVSRCDAAKRQVLIQINRSAGYTTLFVPFREASNTCCNTTTSKGTVSAVTGFSFPSSSHDTACRIPSIIFDVNAWYVETWTLTLTSSSRDHNQSFLYETLAFLPGADLGMIPDNLQRIPTIF